MNRVSRFLTSTSVLRRPFHASRMVRLEEHRGGQSKLVKFSVDRSGLMPFGGPTAPRDDGKPKVPKEELTPLARDLLSYIQMRGPITLHDYMSQTANHLIHGYYQSEKEKIGSKGDFITAPELSQLFGEIVGIWCVHNWELMGQPHRLRLIELGPGKGSLMSDVLRVAKRFPPFHKALTVHLVELSQNLRLVQRQAIFRSIDKQAKNPYSEIKSGDRIEDEQVFTTPFGTNVSWHSFLSQVHDDPSPVVVTIHFTLMSTLSLTIDRYRKPPTKRL